MNSNALQLITFGVSTLLLGGFLGDELNRRYQIRQDIKDLEEKHEKTLQRMDSIYVLSMKNEQAALEQVQNIYTILDMLTAQEAKARKDYNAISNKTKESRAKTDQSQQNLSQAIQDAGVFKLRKKSEKTAKPN